MKLHFVAQPNKFKWMIFCPACQRGHGIDLRWTVNGTRDSPTIEPSLLIAAPRPTKPPMVCHSTIKDGMITFCADSTHELSGKTIPLLDF